MLNYTKKSLAFTTDTIKKQKYFFSCLGRS